MQDQSFGGRRREDVLHGRTMQIESPLGAVFVTLNENADGVPFEMFLNLGKSGSDAAADAEAIGRLCTLLLRVPSTISEVQRLEFVVKHLSGIGGSKEIAAQNHRVRSIADAVAQAVKRYLQSKNCTSHNAGSSASGNLCSTCGQITFMSEELEWCECGWTRALNPRIDSTPTSFPP